ALNITSQREHEIARSSGGRVMDRRFLSCLAICLMTASAATAAQYGQQGRPVAYQAQPEPDSYADGDSGDGYEGYDDGGGGCGCGCDDGGCGCNSCNSCCNNMFSDCCGSAHGFWVGGEYL